MQEFGLYPMGNRGKLEIVSRDCHDHLCRQWGLCNAGGRMPIRLGGTQQFTWVIVGTELKYDSWGQERGDRPQRPFSGKCHRIGHSLDW